MIDDPAAIAAGLRPALVGTLLVLAGCPKLYGFARGVTGGRDKPFGRRPCGTRPSWTSRRARLGLGLEMPLLFLAVVLAELAWVAVALWPRSAG